MSFILQIRCQIRHLNVPRYKGPFEYKKTQTMMRRFPFGVNEKAVHEEFDEVERIRQMQITTPSPLHLVWRYQKLAGTLWTQKVVLRRLGLHNYNPNFAVVLPNTPHFNNMLWEVKHLIRLKPITFADGLPQEKDIGATRVNTETGVMTINESYRISDERLQNAKSADIFVGKYLREYLKWVSGMFNKAPPTADILKYSGNRVDEFAHHMRNANKHQSEYYNVFKSKYH